MRPPRRCPPALDCGGQQRNKVLFDEFHAQETRWREETGLELVWERLPERRASRMAIYLSFDIEDLSAREAARGEAASALVRMYTAMNRPLRERALALRQLSPVREAPDSSNTATAADGGRASE